MPGRRGRRGRGRGRRGRGGRGRHNDNDEEEEEQPEPETNQEFQQHNPGDESKTIVLMVAEKPSIAQTISRILGGSSVKSYKGRSRVCPIYQYYGNFMKYDAKFLVTSVAGHVMERDFPKKYKNWDSCDPKDLFDAEAVKMDVPKKNFHMSAHLKSVTKRIDALVLWLDCDREGENICFEVMDIVKGKLSGPEYDTVFRAKFSSLAEKDINEAFANLKERPDLNQSLSVDARQIIDLKVGVAFSRFQTRYLQKAFPSLKIQLASYGPCQIPTLGFCVDQYEKILSFKPTDFYFLSSSISVNSKLLVLKWTHEGCKIKDEAEKHLSAANSTAALLTSITSSTKSKKKPTGLNTVALLKAAVNYMGIGSHEAMKIAESLYLRGYVTYPRTESTNYSPNFDFKSAISKLQSHPLYGAFCTKMLSEGYHAPKEGVNAGDHPPITPCSLPNYTKLGDKEKKLYDIICANYLASLSSNITYEKVVANFKIGEEDFTCKGIQLKTPGFSEVMPYAIKKDVILPQLNKGEKYVVDSIAIKQGKTSPPDLINESDLISKMEANGIGTDASIPTHIQNIIDRGYVEILSGKRKLQPTGFGLALARAYYDIDKDLVLPAVRANIEKMCDEIAKGKSKFENMLEKSIKLFKEKYHNFVTNIGKIDFHINEQIRTKGFSLKGDSIKEEPITMSICKKCYYGRLLLFVRQKYIKCDSCDFNVNAYIGWVQHCSRQY